MNQTKPRSLFEQILFEAPGDPPPDIPDDVSSSDPPDISGDDAGGGDPPDLDMGGDSGGGMEGNDPPDMGMGDEDSGDESGGFETEDAPEEGQEGNLELDEKISTVMNQALYQRYLTLLNSIGNQLSMIKNNSDILHTLSSDSLEIIGALKKLDENLRLYIDNHFVNENYSKNLLFFNKCLNLLKLLNDVFEKNIQKGIKGME